MQGRGPLLLLLIAALLPLTAVSESQLKPKLLTSAEESRWISNVKSHRVQDGSSVIAVLKYAEEKRPKKFKVAEIGVGYNGASGEPDSVFINYWIGNKRKRDESFVDLGYDLRKDGSLPREIHASEQPMQAALEKGKDAFLAAVDAAYLSDCKDDASGKFVC